MGITFALIAGIFGAVFSYFMRRSIDKGGTTLIFTIVQLLLCAIFATIIGPIRTGNYAINGPILMGASITGLFLGMLMWAIGQGLKRGPAGMIFTMVNAACVAPALILFLLFGSPFGFSYTLWHVLGSLLVVIGLMWAGIYVSRQSEKKGSAWVVFGVLCFIFQALFFLGLQWRALHLQEGRGFSNYLFAISTQEAATEWFLPVLSLTAALSQVPFFLKSPHKPKRAEIICGVLGGSVNSLSIYFLMFATLFASASERPIIFPVAAITVILLCNSWGQVIYKERVHWIANVICVFGVFISQIGEIQIVTSG